MKKILTTAVFCLLGLITALTFVGCSNEADTKQTYTSDAGISIVLPEGFIEKEYILANYYLQAEDCLFMATKETFEDLDYYTYVNGESSLEDYADLIIMANSLTATVRTEKELTCFSYSTTVSGKTFYYLAVVVKGSDSFWLCQFACLDSEKENFEQTFLDWSTTIQVN